MAELNYIPMKEQMCALIGDKKYSAWLKMCSLTDDFYDMQRMWNSGGKKWTYEYKYRRGGKTLCAFYAKPGTMGFMIIFGREEQVKVEALRDSLSEHTLRLYDEATVYHDGKWVMFDENLPQSDMLALLNIKRKPNKK